MKLYVPGIKCWSFSLEHVICLEVVSTWQCQVVILHFSVTCFHKVTIICEIYVTTLPSCQKQPPQICPPIVLVRVCASPCVTVSECFHLNQFNSIKSSHINSPFLMLQFLHLKIRVILVCISPQAVFRMWLHAVELVGVGNWNLYRCTASAPPWGTDLDSTYPPYITALITGSEMHNWPLISQAQGSTYDYSLCSSSNWRPVIGKWTQQTRLLVPNRV